MLFKSYFSVVIYYEMPTLVADCLDGMDPVCADRCLWSEGVCMLEGGTLFCRFADFCGIGISIIILSYQSEVSDYGVETGFLHQQFPACANSLQNSCRGVSTTDF